MRGLAADASLSAPRKQEPAELVVDAAAPPEAEVIPEDSPPSNALGSAWSLRTIRIVEATPVFPPDMQVRLIVVGGIKRQLQVATDDKYLYRAAEGHQRRWRQFAPDEGFRADTRGYMGLGSVRAYIQTGNAVFHANEVDAIGLPEKIKVEIGTRHGFAPGSCSLWALDEMESAIARSPYPEAASDPKSVHLTFLTSAPRTPDLTILESVRRSSERFALKGRVFYLNAPEGVARSRLFTRIERSLGVVGTARNWRTACKILELAQQVSAADHAPGVAQP